MTPPHFNTNQSSYNNPQTQQQFSPSQFGSIHPNQHYSSTYPSQSQFNHSSVLSSYPYQSQMNHQTSSVPQIAYPSPQVTTQPITESPLMDSSFVVPVFSPGDDPIAYLNKKMAFLTVVASSRNAAWYKEKAMLAEAREARQILDEEQLAFLADPGTEDLDTYDSDYDDISNAQAVLMAYISNYGSDIILEEKANMEQNNESVTAELERYKERVKTFEQRLNINLSSHEKMIDSQIDDMIREKLALKDQVNSLEQNLSKQIKEKECLLQTFTVFKNESKEKEDKYMENEIDLEKKIKELDNILFKVGQSAQTVHMLTKPQAFYDNIHKQALGYQNPFHLKKAQRIKPTLYDGIVMSDKHVAMPVIDDEETLILEEESRSKIKPSDALPIKIKAPKELPKISLVNESYKNLKFHLAKFDNVVKIRTTPDACTEGEWGFEHTKAVFNNEIIPFLKSLKDIFNVFDRDLLDEIMEVKTVFDQMDTVVQHSSVDKQCLEIAKKEILFKNDRLLQQIMSQKVLLTVMNSMSLIGKSVNMDGKRKESYDLENDLKAQLQDKDSTICKLKDIIKSMREKSKEKNVNCNYCEIETKNVELENSVAKLLSENEHLYNEINHVKQVFKEQFDSIKKTRVRNKEQSDSLIDKLNLKSAEYEDLKAQILDKVFVITSLKNNLQKLKLKEIVDIAEQIPSATTIVPGMFKLDLEPLAPRLLQNREAHLEYLKYTQEQADIHQGIVEQAKVEQPLDKELDFACKHAQQIQELLVYVRDTCPNAINLGAKKVVVTPKNKVKKVRFAKPLTSSSNSKQVVSSKTPDSNTPVLSSTRLKCSTSKSGSKPTNNKKNDRISQTPSRNMKNKVEAQPRNINKKNCVVKPINDDDVKHSLLNANFELICATCKKSLFDGVHDICFLDYVKNVNSHAKSAKKYKKENI
ncbi:hypothetical protein Tco_0394033 [Tanacetum coccineum]